MVVGPLPANVSADGWLRKAKRFRPGILRQPVDASATATQEVIKKQRKVVYLFSILPTYNTRLSHDGFQNQRHPNRLFGKIALRIHDFTINGTPHHRGTLRIQINGCQCQLGISRKEMCFTVPRWQRATDFAATSGFASAIP